MNPYSSLSPSQSSIVRTVRTFQMASSSQLRRLIYSGTYRGVRVRSSDHLKKLTDRGLLWRVPIKFSTHPHGSGEYVYTPPPNKKKRGRRTPDIHRLDILELFVQLTNHIQSTENIVMPGEEVSLRDHVPESSKLIYLPEGAVDKYWDGQIISPDAYVKYQNRQYLIEIDEGSEVKDEYNQRLNTYIKAIMGSKGTVFPIVIWVATELTDVNLIQGLIDSKPRELRPAFRVMAFQQAVKFITEGVEP